MSSKILEFHRREDFCEYFLFPKLTGEVNVNDGEETTTVVVDNEQTEFLNVLKEIQLIVSKLCEGYIWQKDGINLTPRYKFNQILCEEDNKNELEILPPHYHGISHYGENIQDEWFIVYVLLEVTKKIPGLVGRIIDSDGEFILIEAAENLPKWANPETCEQRVYLTNGEVFLIRNENPASETIFTMTEGLRIVRSGRPSSELTVKITEHILDRIKGYPEQIKDDTYRTTVYVPLELAKCLTQRPELISSACNSFYNRDMIDMKACRAMRYFPPENRVYMTAVFSKCLYAMIMHTKYVPDRKIGWNLPPPGDKLYKSHELGMKLACGFEILASQAKPPQSLDDDKGWKSYITSLTNRNYFQGNIEGSQDYQKLLEGAKLYYRENRDSMNSAEAAGQEILNLLKEVKTNDDNFPQEFDSNCIDEEDSWLNISPEQLDEIMTKRYGIKKILSVNGNSDVHLTDNVNEFLERKSEFDGVENDGGGCSKLNEMAGLHQLMNETNGSCQSAGDEDDDKISFDPDAFKSQVNKYLDLMIPEDSWESNSDMSDYADDDDIGKKMDSSLGAKKMDMKKYMKEMDLELSKTTIGKSFETKGPATTKVKGRSKDDSYMFAEEDDFDDVEDFTPVDIDKNMLKNMVEGYQSQVGGPGPISNLLSSMGFGLKLDDDADDSDSAIEAKITQV